MLLEAGQAQGAVKLCYKCRYLHITLCICTCEGEGGGMA